MKKKMNNFTKQKAEDKFWCDADSPILWPMMERFFSCRAVGVHFTDHQTGRFSISSQNKEKVAKICQFSKVLLWCNHGHKQEQRRGEFLKNALNSHTVDNSADIRHVLGWRVESSRRTMWRQTVTCQVHRHVPALWEEGQSKILTQHTQGKWHQTQGNNLC